VYVESKTQGLVQCKHSTTELYLQLYHNLKNCYEYQIFSGFLLFYFFETGPVCVTQAVLKFVILLPQLHARIINECPILGYFSVFINISILFNLKYPNIIKYVETFS
jgi:hypothetical protein